MEIKAAHSDLAFERRKELFESMSEAEFIDCRVDIYLKEPMTSINSGLDQAGAEEIAGNEAMGDLLNRHA